MLKPKYTIIFILSYFFSGATTIRPFDSFLDLHEKATCIVLTQYSDSLGHEVIRTFKGQFDSVEAWGDSSIIILGDPEYTDGVNYLLFLDEINKPICLSYYVFAQIDSLFVRSPQSSEISIVGDPDRGNAYLVEELIRAISAKEYTHLEPIPVGTGPMSRAAPNHCTFLQNSQGTRYRWEIWDTAASPLLPVHPTAWGDATCTGINEGALTEAIEAIQLSYMGTNLVLGDGHMFTPGCAGGTALAGDFKDYILSTYGDRDRILIQMNDPCSEISDLAGCSGTLAVGGAFGVNAHIFDGAAWFTAGFGFVILNNGIGCIGCAGNLEAVLSHEIGHSLGMGHISSSHGSANMNPACCKTISELDITCFDYSYPSAALPVEFISLKVRQAPAYNEIIWQVGVETNVERYELETSTDGIEFGLEKLILARGSEFYEAAHWYPPDRVFYRIKTKDWDGSTEYSRILYSTRQEAVAAVLDPAVSQGQGIRIYSLAFESVIINDTLGREFGRFFKDPGHSTIDTAQLAPGIYVLRFTFSGKKFIFTVL